MNEIWHAYSPRAGLHDLKILWAKVQKRRRYGDGGENVKPHFLETGEIWSTCFGIF